MCEMFVCTKMSQQYALIDLHFDDGSKYVAINLKSRFHSVEKLRFVWSVNRIFTVHLFTVVYKYIKWRQMKVKYSNRSICLCK